MVSYQKGLVGLTSTSWERESDPRHHRRAILLYKARMPGLRGGEESHRYFTMRRCPVAMELHRKCGERFVANGLCLVSGRQYERLSNEASGLRGAHIWLRTCGDLWSLGIIHEVD